MHPTISSAPPIMSGAEARSPRSASPCIPDSSPISSSPFTEPENSETPAAQEKDAGDNIEAANSAGPEETEDSSDQGETGAAEAQKVQEAIALAESPISPRLKRPPELRESASLPENPASDTTAGSLPSASPPNPPLSAKEQAFAAAKAKKMAALQARNAVLEAQIAETQAKLDAVRADMKDPANARAIVRTHIANLHAYNEIRDIGQGLLGMIADQRGVRIRDVYGEFGVGVED